MKMNVLKPLLFLLVLTVSVSCNDRNAEKRIAELESRLKDLEGKKTPNPVSSPASVITPTKDEKPEGPLAEVSFAQLEHDFGTINEGDVVEHTFTFKNTGTAPLIIQSASPTCGCTVPDWSKDPIPAGGTGFVKAKFDSNGRPNAQNKSITVTANTYPKQTVLRFKAMVLPKSKEVPSDGPVRK